MLKSRRAFFVELNNKKAVWLITKLFYVVNIINTFEMSFKKSIQFETIGLANVVKLHKNLLN